MRAYEETFVKLEVEEAKNQAWKFIKMILEAQRRLNFQLQQVCYTKVRPLTNIVRA